MQLRVASDEEVLIICGGNIAFEVLPLFIHALLLVSKIFFYNRRLSIINMCMAAKHFTAFSRLTSSVSIIISV